MFTYPKATIPDANPVQATSGDVTIQGYEMGDKSLPRVIYVHGTPGDATMWESYVMNPVEGSHSLSISRPGFGKSKPGQVVTDLKTHAEILEPFLENDNNAGTILVGHSYGGPVIAKAAVLYPDKIGGLIIIAGSLDPELEPATWWRYIFYPTPAKWIIGKSLYNSNREIIALRQELEILEKELKELTVPV